MLPFKFSPRKTLCLVGFVTAAASAAADADVIARAGTIEVRVADLDASLGQLSDEEKTALRMDPQLLSQVVRSLAAQRLVVNEATQKSWDKRPEVLLQLERARESVIAESYLGSVSAPPADYPSDSEVKDLYETNRASFHIPKSYRLSQIYVDIKPDENAAYRRLDKVLKLLEPPSADFSSVAKAHSEEPGSAARGGELGWLSEEQVHPEIRPELPGMKLGSVSKPFKLNDGWHILKVLDIKEASTLTLEQARPSIVKQLRAAKSKANSDAYLAELLRANPVAINELALPQALTAKTK